MDELARLQEMDRPKDNGLIFIVRFLLVASMLTGLREWIVLAIASWTIAACAMSGIDR